MIFNRKRAPRGVCAFLLVISLFAACGAAAKLDLLPENIADDNYGNYYEIFVSSFCDSDGDGVGDLKGVAQKTSYIRDLGYTGIWLTPIHPSPSYHKYDVIDYCAVDKRCGDLSDFEALILEAHSRGIKIILDLVVNHTSREHEWFKRSAAARLAGDSSDPYYDYYNFSPEPKNGYTRYNGGAAGIIYYESRFSPDMPDLNLDSDSVRGEIIKIIDFWLSLGADGFRLDACTSYYTGDHAKSASFCGWLTDQIRARAPSAFVVGEVWENAAVIRRYYEAASGASFFYFPSSTNLPDNPLITMQNADAYYTLAQSVLSSAAGGIPAPFLCNHDLDRIAGAVARKPERIKFAYGLLSLLNGAVFTYYGDEIGTIGSLNDPNRRIGMLWNLPKNAIKPPEGATSAAYAFDGVKKQRADANSILSYYKRANNIRNAFPEIARGDIERIECADKKTLVMRKTYGGSAITVAINFDSVAARELIGDYGALRKDLCAFSGDKARLDGDKLTLPPYSFAILK